IVGDLITLINTYLNGEISERFAYKFLAVLVISAIVFTYYLLQKGESSFKAKKARVILAWVGAVVVLGIIISGFIVVGTPGKQRAIRFDSQRVSDLSNIQWQVVSYWQQKGKLPASLADINDSISGRSIPTDPENKSEYKYNVKSPMQFELCGVFSLKTQDTKG